LFAQRTRIPTSARSIGFCAIWVCISSSSKLVVFCELPRLATSIDPWNEETKKLGSASELVLIMGSKQEQLNSNT